MKREEVLKKLGFQVPNTKTKRVIISTDLNNEADDHFAVMHHLLTPSTDVRGIVAAHYEWTSRMVESQYSDMENKEELLKKFGLVRGGSAQLSYEVGKKLLSLAEIDDIPLFKGSDFEIQDINNLPQSEGVDFIIEEALKEDDKPLYIAILGSITDLAVAYLKEPKIAEKLTAIWIGGGEYPTGEGEFNLIQDVLAANIVFESPIPVWQVPCNVYRTIEVSQAELSDHIRPLGKLGEYLCDQMIEFNFRVSAMTGLDQFPHGESWCLGDNPTVTVLLQGAGRKCWHEIDAPQFNDDGTYKEGKGNKKIRVYDNVDSRLTLSDFFSKMSKCYRT